MPCITDHSKGWKIIWAEREQALTAEKSLRSTPVYFGI